MNIDKMLNNILGKSKKANIKTQYNWKTFSPMKKNISKMLFRDSDRDGVPNRWDCQPMNPRRQEDKMTEDKYIRILAEDIYETIVTWDNNIFPPVTETLIEMFGSFPEKDVRKAIQYLKDKGYIYRTGQGFWSSTKCS